MWHLNSLSEETLKWYKDKFLDDICKCKNQHPKLCPRVKGKLTDGVIEKLLISKPAELYPLAAKLEKENR